MTTESQLSGHPAYGTAAGSRPGHPEDDTFWSATGARSPVAT